VFCTRCGQQNPPEAAFCARCGAPLVRPGEPVAHAPAVAAERSDSTSTISLTGLSVGAEDMEDTGEPELSAVDALPPGSALLVVKRGPNAGSRFLLDQPVTTAGRHPESDIFLDDVTVSRRHAEFRREEGAFSVHDVGSLNGTYLNRERIDAAELSGGDEVQIGKFRLLFLLAGPQGSADAPSEHPAAGA
jgi:hypothetical protein